eukprot:4706370-Pleurochrysis_carterae.AAC.1
MHPLNTCSQHALFTHEHLTTHRAAHASCASPTHALTSSMATLFSHAARQRGAAATSAAANASAPQSSTYPFVIFAEPTAS